MKPPPFRPQVLADTRFVCNLTDGRIWHRCSHRTLYADTDRSQVVYHANYLRYFELGRATLMRDVAYPYLDIENSGYVYPIIEIGVNYYTALRYDDPFWIYTRPATRERVRLRFDYTITHAVDDTLVCQGFTRHCATNTAGVPVAVDPKTAHLWDSFPRYQDDGTG